MNFSHNKITKIQPFTFNGLTNLEEIDFSWNRIVELDPDAFNGSSNLKKINFSLNQITNIHPCLFNGLINLEVIDFLSHILILICSPRHLTFYLFIYYFQRGDLSC